MRAGAKVAITGGRATASQWSSTCWQPTWRPSRRGVLLSAAACVLTWLSEQWSGRLASAGSPRRSCHRWTPSVLRPSGVAVGVPWSELSFCRLNVFRRLSLLTGEGWPDDVEAVALAGFAEAGDVGRGRVG